MEIRENVPIGQLTTMRLGGEARYVISVKNLAELRQAYDFAHKKHLPVFVLGSGANIIGRDSGFKGVIIKNEITGDVSQRNINDGEAEFTAPSGMILDDFIAHVSDLGFTGIEAMSKIPGTVGSAPVQNVGAYGQDISQVLQSVEVYDAKDDIVKTIAAEDCNFTYRHSIFNTDPELAERYFILSITVKLQKANPQPPFYNSLQAYIDSHDIKEITPAVVRQAVSEIRAQKLPDPDKVASAGSFFQNVYLSSPEEIAAAEEKGIPVWEGGKISGAWLMDQSGLKGKEFHGFKVWESAPLVLANVDAKSFADLKLARQEIRAIVQEKFGYTLNQEPVELGEED